MAFIVYSYPHFTLLLPALSAPEAKAVTVLTHRPLDIKLNSTQSTTISEGKVLLNQTPLVLFLS
jgi:hypothetical protein